VVWAMPRAVAEAKLQDAILPVTEIAREIHRRCRRSET
jgi:chemotaxis response regulator CheB